MGAVNERMRAVRQALGMSQKTFAESLDMKQTSISGIENNPNRVVTDRVINAVCRVHHVNRDWLVTGTGEMFNPAEDTLEDLVLEQELTPREAGLIKLFVQQPPAVRQALLEFMDSYAKQFWQADGQEKEIETDEELEAAFRRQLEEEKGESQASGRTASDTG